MNKEDIKTRFYNHSSLYPFLSSDFWQYFGYARHNVFLKYLRRHEFQDEICEKYGIISKRKGWVIYFSRFLFCKLSKIHQVDENIIHQIFLLYKESVYKSAILKFTTYAQRYSTEYRAKNHLCLTKEKGTFYSYSLNISNLAAAIEVDPFDLMTFCSKRYCSKVSFQGACFTNPYGLEHESPIPYVHFDHKSHEKRYAFINFIDLVLTEFSLSELQKELLIIYRRIISELLNKQVDHDFREGRREKKEGAWKTYTFRYTSQLSKEDQKELNKLYRQAALLCHPDKNENGEELFKKLNSAKQNNDLHSIKEILSSLK